MRISDLGYWPTEDDVKTKSTTDEWPISGEIIHIVLIVEYNLVLSLWNSILAVHAWPFLKQMTFLHVYKTQICDKCSTFTYKDMVAIIYYESSEIVCFKNDKHLVTFNLISWKKIFCDNVVLNKNVFTMFHLVPNGLSINNICLFCYLFSYRLKID